MARTAMARGGRLTAKQIRRYKNARSWYFYDRRIFSTGVIPPDSAAFNFAQFASPLVFFQPRVNSNPNGYALTNMNDSGKMEYDFEAHYLSVLVHCDTDAPAAAGIATATAFVESIVNYGVLLISFGGDPEFVAPVSRLPAGGGVYSETKVRLLAVAANSDSAGATNGFPSRSAIKKLPEPIMFKKGSVFSCQLIVDAIPAATSTVARINALQALTTTFKAVIEVTLEGIRGKPFLEGTPDHS